MTDAVSVRNLIKHYGNTIAVDGISFSAAEGEIFGLLGRNGAGKTTAVECIIGLRRPDGGTIEVLGIDALTQPNLIKRQIGVQLQATALQDKITPREALTLFASFHEGGAKVDALIQRFDLAEAANAHFDTLSGGQRQRLALALAFVNQPRVLFLDEPTAGLDAQSRRQLHATIRQMKGEGHTIVLTTHYIEEAEELCDHLAIVDHGRVVAAGTPADLIAAAHGLSRIDLRTAKPLDPRWIEKLAAVREVEERGAGWRLKTESTAQTLAELVGGLQTDGNNLIDLHVAQPSLEDVFIGLTGGI
jgi:ABC-2 type transport system ATP-binding protein